MVHSEALALYTEGYVDWKIAKVLHVSDTTVRKWRHRNNLPSNWKRGITGQNIDQTLHEKVLKLYNSGMSDIAISKIIDYSFSSVRRWRVEHGLKANFAWGGGNK